MLFEILYNNMFPKTAHLRHQKINVFLIEEMNKACGIRDPQDQDLTGCLNDVDCVAKNYLKISNG